MDAVFNMAVVMRLVDNLSKPLRTLQGTVDGFARMGEAGRRMQQAGRELAIGGATAAGGVAAIGAPLKALTDTAADFEQAMAGVRAVTGAITEDEFSALRDRIRELGGSTSFSTMQVADAARFLAQAGFDAQAQMTALPAMLDLARAGSVELGRAADIVSNIMSGFGLEADETRRAADALVGTFTSSNVTVEMLGQTMKHVAPIARTAGMSLEEAAAMAGLLGNAGIQGENAGTAMRAILTRLAAPTETAAAMVGELGVELADAEGNVRSMTAIMAELGAAMEGMGSARQIALLSEVMGMEASAAGRVLSGQDDDAAALMRELAGAATTAAEVAREMAATARGAQTEFVSAVEAMRITLGTGLLPALTDVVRQMTSLVRAATEFAAANPGVTKNALLIAAGVAAAGAVVAPILLGVGALVALAGSILRVVGPLGRGLALVVARAPMMGAALAGAFRVVAAAVAANPIGAAITAIATAAWLIRRNWDALAAWFTTLWNEPREAFRQFGDWLGSLIPGWNAIGRDLVQGLIDGITAMASQAYDTVANLAGGVADRFRGWLGIESPSVVFQGFGADVVSGLVRGIEAGRGAAAGAGAGLAEATLPPAPRLAPVGGGGGRTLHVDFRPTINLQGGAGAPDWRGQLEAALREMEGELVRIVQDADARERRRDY